MSRRKIRMGMIGGGMGAFIGEVHRMAAALDGHIELVCGAFSSDPERSKKSGEQLYLDPDRVYGTFDEMMAREKELPEEKRMELVSIVTPNHVHFPAAKAALESGFHVICDKPMTVSLDEAKELRRLVNDTGLLFALTHTYTGYPMVKQARQLVRDGKLGTLRKVVVEYPQGWLASKIEEENKQAAWRTDPARSGPAGAMGDIGTHAENLAEYVTGLQIKELCADLTAFVPGRRLDDDGNILLRFEGGAKGVLHASQVSAGEENSLKIYVYGEKGGVEWHQMEPNTLWVRYGDRPEEKWRTGMPYLDTVAEEHTRVPAGHPEGYLEAFANLYRNVAFALQRRAAGQKPQTDLYDYPTVEDGVRGIAFIDTVIASSNGDAKWTPFVKYE